MSWFQAAQACALSGKRMLTNQEWQVAAAGTPDPGMDDGATTCVTGTFAGPAATGSRSQCRSNWGVFDMVGNVWEWVADWIDLLPNCTDWQSTEGISNGDRSCFGAPGGPGGAHDLQSIPGALFRGGNWVDGLGAGVFAVEPRALSVQLPDVGFRCAR